VDLSSLVGGADGTLEDLASKFIDDLDADLDACITSLEFIYGISVGSDFRHLAMVLLKCGHTFPDAVREILDGKYGVYHNWLQACLQLDVDHTAKRGASITTLDLRSTPLDDGFYIDR
jgi:hypothetical protein